MPRGGGWPGSCPAVAGHDEGRYGRDLLGTADEASGRDDDQRGEARKGHASCGVSSVTGRAKGGTMRVMSLSGSRS